MSHFKPFTLSRLCRRHRQINVVDSAFASFSSTCQHNSHAMQRSIFPCQCHYRACLFQSVVFSNLLSSLSSSLNTSLAPHILKRQKISIPEFYLTESFLKGSGPGGQKINKTASAVQIKHEPTGIVVKTQASRSRTRNRQIARKILADRLEEIELGDQSRLGRRRERERRRKAGRRKKAKRKYGTMMQGQDRGKVGEEGIQMDDGEDRGNEDDVAGGPEDGDNDEKDDEDFDEPNMVDGDMKRRHLNQEKRKRRPSISDVTLLNPSKASSTEHKKPKAVAYLRRL